MVVAFVFVKGETDKRQDVNDSLEKLVKQGPAFNVQPAYNEPLSEEYCSILKLEGDFDDIGKYVVAKIKPMPGVDDLKTMVCVGDKDMRGIVRPKQ